MKDHELKCLDRLFGDLIDGTKPFEYRQDDRGFEEGDTLYLREIYIAVAGNHVYTGRRARFLIKKIWRDIPGMSDGFCIMTVQILEYWEVKEVKHENDN